MAKARVIKATNKCAKRVKLARVEKEMTQLDLATALNVDCNRNILSRKRRTLRQRFRDYRTGGSARQTPDVAAVWR